MSPDVFLVVLAAAALHAGWNTLLKLRTHPGAIPLDPMAASLMLGIAAALVSLFILPATGLPAPPSWPYALASAVIHVAYYLLVGAAYRAADLSAVAFALGCVLQPGEALDSDRAMAQGGPRAAVLLHRAADEALAGLPNTSAVPPEVAETVAAYVEYAKTFEPADARYLENHRGHLMKVMDNERRFVTGELIRQTTFTGTEPDLLERIAALRDAGYTQFTIQLTPGNEAAIEDWGRLKAKLG